MTPLVLIMGVSGCGKSSVAQALARRLDWRFIDADDYHPARNIEKMRTGMALNDEDRMPWLDRLNAVLRHSAAKAQPMVLACSALRETYRLRLADRLDALSIVHLQGDFDTIAARLALRQHRYMPASLLRSQFDTLEAPTDALVIDIREDLDRIVDRLAARWTPTGLPADPAQSNHQK